MATSKQADTSTTHRTAPDCLFTMNDNEWLWQWRNGVTLSFILDTKNVILAKPNRRAEIITSDPTVDLISSIVAEIDNSVENYYNN